MVRALRAQIIGAHSIAPASTANEIGGNKYQPMNQSATRGHSHLQSQRSDRDTGDGHFVQSDRSISGAPPHGRKGPEASARPQANALLQFHDFPNDREVHPLTQPSNRAAMSSARANGRERPPSTSRQGNGRDQSNIAGREESGGGNMQHEGGEIGKQIQWMIADLQRENDRLKAEYLQKNDRLKAEYLQAQIQLLARQASEMAQQLQQAPNQHLLRDRVQPHAVVSDVQLDAGVWQAQEGAAGMYDAPDGGAYGVAAAARTLSVGRKKAQSRPNRDITQQQQASAANGQRDTRGSMVFDAPGPVQLFGGPEEAQATSRKVVVSGSRPVSAAAAGATHQSECVLSMSDSHPITSSRQRPPKASRTGSGVLDRLHLETEVPSPQLNVPSRRGASAKMSQSTPTYIDGDFSPGNAAPPRNTRRAASTSVANSARTSVAGGVHSSLVVGSFNEGDVAAALSSHALRQSQSVAASRQSNNGVNRLGNGSAGAAKGKLVKPSVPGMAADDHADAVSARPKADRRLIRSMTAQSASRNATDASVRNSRDAADEDSGGKGAVGRRCLISTTQQQRLLRDHALILKDLQRRLPELYLQIRRRKNEQNDKGFDLEFQVIPRVPNISTDLVDVGFFLAQFFMNRSVEWKVTDWCDCGQCLKAEDGCVGRRERVLAEALLAGFHLAERSAPSDVGDVDEQEAGGSDGGSPAEGMTDSWFGDEDSENTESECAESVEPCHSNTTAESDQNMAGEHGDCQAVSNLEEMQDGLVDDELFNNPVYVEPVSSAHNGVQDCMADPETQRYDNNSTVVLDAAQAGEAGSSAAAADLAEMEAAAAAAQECIICQDRNVDTRLMPCRHWLCHDCTARVRHRTLFTSSAGSSCPFCRQTVVRFQTVPSAVVKTSHALNWQTQAAPVWAPPAKPSSLGGPGPDGAAATATAQPPAKPIRKELCKYVAEGRRCPLGGRCKFAHACPVSGRYRVFVSSVPHPLTKEDLLAHFQSAISPAGCGCGGDGGGSVDKSAGDGGGGESSTGCVRVAVHVKPNQRRFAYVAVETAAELRRCLECSDHWIGSVTVHVAQANDPLV